jgi:Fe-S cluster assembly ATP-binding protein
MLKPQLALLDEIDSGLDIDALNVVGSALQKMANENSEISMLLITHYQRLLDYIKPTHVHVMLDGKIVESGDFSIVKVIEKDGYQVYRDKYNLEETKEEATRIKVGSCAVHEGVK